LNNAITVTSKNGVAKYNIVTVKFAAPIVARPIKSVVPDPSRVGPPLFPDGPNLTAIATKIGNERMNAYAKAVRFRFNWRYSSTE
jgi:hypothetical protein